MSRLRYLAAQGLADIIGQAVAPFQGRAVAPQQPPTEVSQYPEVVVLPLRHVTEWWYEQPLCDDSGAVVLDSNGDPVYLLGSEDGTTRLHAVARTEHAREDLEDAAMAAFNQLPGRPGLVVVDIANPVVAGRTIPATIRASFSLRSAEWREEMVFSERRIAWLDCDSSIAVIASRPIAQAPIAAQIQILLSHDIETDITGLAPDDAIAALQPIEQVTVT